MAAMLTLTCDYSPCGNTFARPSWQVSAANFCSHPCYLAARKDRQAQISFADRFWSKVAICDHGRTCEDCCWPWTGATHANGYGNFRATPYKEGNVSAHIISWFVKTGEWPPEGLFVLHTCDVKPCVQNNTHLFLGTHTDNMQDMIGKGRQGYLTHPERVLRGDKHPARLRPDRMARGDRNGMRLHPESVLRGDKSPVMKVTEAQVKEASQLYATGQWTFAQLGKRYNITGPGIRQRIRHQKSS
jgi:hypothetical protein